MCSLRANTSSSWPRNASFVSLTQFNHRKTTIVEMRYGDNPLIEALTHLYTKTGHTDKTEAQTTKVDQTN